MKPTKMRNKTIYAASHRTRSRQLGGALSEDLRKRYKRRSVRVVEGDSVSVVRGEFTGVDGKVAKVSAQKNSVAIDGVKKEKTSGGKFDVYIHTTNLVVTSLNSEDRWRIARLEGKSPKREPKKPRPEEPRPEGAARPEEPRPEGAEEAARPEEPRPEEPRPEEAGKKLSADQSLPSLFRRPWGQIRPAGKKQSAEPKETKEAEKPEESDG